MRIYNNYDGWMYSVHNLPLGYAQYKGVPYELDDEMESDRLLNLLEEDGILDSVVFDNGLYKEKHYRFTEENLSIELRDLGLHCTFYQKKAILLNFKHNIV